ncbi:AGE family epimerase/isomerase [Achromobacter seleniivolatilans]|uniref:AGE family epimerase/isomerase n=1 Tax=Achromobacter seleniivolatilans TaxID=3047478 RepID=A0ABY9M9J7_9BURK|nr:AGE family epimerase/isomerase [Achromobacter sp. R39]WMD23707.1 AGE family epimerase/isomerase [Achromobacter sp. R39]
MTAAQTNSSLAEHIRALREHFDSVVLPMWMGRGFNDALGLPFESLDAATGAPVLVTRYRAMACARQLYVFAQAPGAAAGKHADRLFASLRRVFRDDTHGGWRYSVDADARPLDDTQDLYTHAFIVLACAAYFQRSRNADARKLMLSTSLTIEARFKSRDGLYYAALSADFGSPLRPPAQNPMMHLTEAYLAAAQVAEPALYAQHLRSLAQAISQFFVHPATQCISEALQGSAGNRLEPGHQFEWLSLVQSTADVFEGLDLVESLPRAVQWSRLHGVGATGTGVLASLDESGVVMDGTRRIWAQTEYLRTLAVLGDWPALSDALAHFRDRFLHAGGWHECLDENGVVTRADMPSTSPYHLATCLAALPNVV